MKQKLSYLIRSLLNVNQRKVCPNCGGNVLSLIDQKYFITKLFRCESCKLNFRFPVDSKAFLNDFYQSTYQADYSDETRSITDLPTDDELRRLMDDNFSNKRNHTPYIYALLKTYSARILDYGCSWGYSVYQLKQAGYDTEGFEISTLRSEFGKKIGVIIHNRTEAVMDRVSSE